MSKNIKTRIQNKHDLEINWLKATFVPLQGELIVYDIEVDANGEILSTILDGQTVQALPLNRTVPYTYERFKLGDGIHTVNELPFVTDPFYTKAEAESILNNIISCGTADPSGSTTSKFYFKYSTE